MIPELGVISRQSSIQFKGSDKNTQQIGEELNVEFILEGTIQKQEQNASITSVRIIPQPEMAPVPVRLRLDYR